MDSACIGSPLVIYLPLTTARGALGWVQLTKRVIGDRSYMVEGQTDTSISLIMGPMILIPKRLPTRGYFTSRTSSAVVDETDTGTRYVKVR